MNLLSPPNHNLSQSNSRSSHGSFVGKKEILGRDGNVVDIKESNLSKHSRLNEEPLDL